MSTPSLSQKPTPGGEVIGRYVLHAPIARGGMATVHMARLVGAEGFSRIVAVKRLHAQFTEDADFVTMFLDEARIASKVHHPNVVPVLDVLVVDGEVILVQEYVHGVPLDRLMKAAQQRTVDFPIPIAAAIAAGVLGGLHAAHQTRDEAGEPLGIVHRDVSPQNVIVSLDGIPRLLDFGIAKARSSVHVTRVGLFKGKVAYMSPEQLGGGEPTAAIDVYAMGVVLWEMLVGKRLHANRDDAELVRIVATGAIPPISTALAERRQELGEEHWQQLQRLEPIVRRALMPHAEDRFASAADMMTAIARAVPVATSVEVAEWVRSVGEDFLAGRTRILAQTEESWRNQRLTSGPGSVPSESGVKRASPGSARRIEVGGVDDAVVTSNPITGSVQTNPEAERRSNRILLLIVLLSLVAGGAIIAVLFLTLRDKPKDAATASSVVPAASTLAAPIGGAAAPSVMATSNPTSAPVATATATAAANAAPGESNTLAPAATAEAAPKPTWHLSKQTAPRPAATVVPAPNAAASATPPPPPQTAKASCNPPFYYEGSKKVFKPECL